MAFLDMPETESEVQRKVGLRLFYLRFLVLAFVNCIGQII